MGMTQANLHRTSHAMSITVCIWAITQYNMAMTFINDRKLSDLVSTNHCNIVQNLNVLEDCNNENG